MALLLAFGAVALLLAALTKGRLGWAPGVSPGGTAPAVLEPGLER